MLATKRELSDAEILCFDIILLLKPIGVIRQHCTTVVVSFILILLNCKSLDVTFTVLENISPHGGPFPEYGVILGHSQNLV